ncbi:MAG: glycosyl hydrolase [bacterium]
MIGTSKNQLVVAFVLAAMMCAAPGLQAEDSLLAFSDPANDIPAPGWTVGQANRSPDLDVLPGFKSPPPGFGVVPFFWWLGDPLTQERLGWILGQMEGMGISGYQINYAHGYKDGGRSYGLTIPSEPPLFSDEWWKLTGWFMNEAKKQSAGISLSDYTLGIGQGWSVDEILRDHPEMCGATLKLVDGKQPDAVMTGTVPGEGGKVREVSVVAAKAELSIDPMHPESGRLYAKTFFGQFEDRLGQEGGKGLNFFFSDELGFGVGGSLWNDRFAAEFKRRKGYDIVPELPALFMDIGPRTPKVRLDYSDVQVALSEEGFFKPVYDWHQQRGMTMGCDHGGRGRNVVEFGDYFRTQRWNQGPGADQPGLSKELIKAKVASSIAHLYQRPRVWLEGYYGSGWGTTSAGIVDATFVNFVRGFNLLSFHGMYYATHGGWWEWAPPDNTFRMPYWKHLRGFMGCVQRLSYLFVQGQHRCDVAILYPVAPMEAGMGGKEAVDAAFTSGNVLYGKSIDFDFMDFQSLARAKVVGKELQVSGESYRVLILPAMRAVRHSTLQKAAEFRRAGGVVLAVGALPEASDRVGRDDAEVAALVKELFPNGPVQDALKAVQAALPDPDYVGVGDVQHRKIGARDVYAIYNAPTNSEATFRATGKVELWDPWTGATRPMPVLSQADGKTTLKLPLTEKEIQLIVFSPGQPEVVAKNAEGGVTKKEIAVEGDWEFELQPTCDNRYGDFHWPATPALIGAEARQLWYCEGETTNGLWRKVTSTFGPQFIQCDSLPASQDAAPKNGKPVEFSWRWGIENVPGMQGYHGLKELVHDEFITIGTAKSGGHGGPKIEAGKSDTYFWTTVVAPKDMTGYVQAGDVKPIKAWLNGAEITSRTVPLKAGANPLVLHYDKSKPGLAYFVVSAIELPEPERVPDRLPQGQQPKFKLSPLASRWWNNPAVLPLDVRSQEKTPIGWYRFVSPPGLRAITIAAHGKVQVWADDKPMLEKATGRFSVAQPTPGPVTVSLRIEQERGWYGGAALSEPIRLDCGAGSMAPGDWSKNEGLASYSGGAWYRKTITIPAVRRVWLDLGDVAASAEVRVNGKPAGVLVAPPWKLDVSSLVKPGENRVEVLVCNTLANHYCTVPTRYRGSPVSGLLGPVTLELAAGLTAGAGSRLQAGGKGSLRIMPLGDSITVGYTDNPQWAHPFEFGYRSGLYQRLMDAGCDFVFVGDSEDPFNNKFSDPTHGGSVRPNLDLRKMKQAGHRGYGGWGVGSIQKNIAQWIKQDRPDIILLQIGINGINATSPQQLDALVKDIYDADKKVKLVVAQITPLKSFNQDLFNYNTYIRQTLVPTYAGKGYAISTIDLYKHFLTNPSDPKSIDPARLSNRINHPTNAFYDKMAESWFQGIRALLTK